MTNLDKYLNFIKSKGRSLAEINPGSDEFALKVEDAFRAIELLENSQKPILGGDILSEKFGTLVYAYQLWGAEYIYLNWYIDKLENETQVQYSNRSYNSAKDFINRANEVAKRLDEDCYIVIVI